MNRLFLGAALLLALMVSSSSQAQTIQTTQLLLVSPATCPSTGCAAGQNLSMQALFDLATYVPANTPNVQLCFYTPINWSASLTSLGTLGGVTGAAYQPSITNCSDTPTGYNLLNGVVATLPTGSFGDSIDFSFRIGNTATLNGSILVRVYENTATGWSQTGQPFMPIAVRQTANSLFVANDSVACGLNFRCYINSGDDLLGGIGTGLKDAIDSHPIPSQPAAITVLGSYLVKSNTIVVNNPHTIQGSSDARITYQGPLCNNPMIRFSNGGSLRNLNINDGNCTVLDRDLVVVESPQLVTIEYNDLTNGKNAVQVLDTNGGALLRFNHITANSGYAILRSPGTALGRVEATGNNLYANRESAQVECNTFGSVEHNFWGFGVNTATAVSQCTVSQGKRLGAPALPRANAPGVSAELVTVTAVKNSAFNGLVGYQRSADGADFPLYIINHGFGTPENVPFTGGTPGSLTPCSNYYDIFLGGPAVIPPETLNLFFRYDRTAGCTATIESSPFCGGSIAANYPLWWYDPANNITDGWDTTGQNPAGSGAGGASGQVTSCDLVLKEIQVAIDASGRPNHLADLNFTPFVVGLQPLPTSVIITRFAAIAGNGQAAIQWTTSSEVNTAGFYVVRSLTESGGFTRVSEYIPRRGSGIGGASYEFVDTGLENGTTYYYRLEIVGTSQESSFSGVISVTPTQTTPTTTATATATASQTVTPSQTPTATATSTVTGTISGNTSTTTATATPSVTVTISGNTSTTTATATRTVTVTISGNTSTTTATPSATVTPTGTITLTRTATQAFTPTRTRTRTPIIYPTIIYRSPSPIPTRTRFPTRTPTFSGSLPTSTPTFVGGGYPPPQTSVTVTRTFLPGTRQPTSPSVTVPASGGYPIGDGTASPSSPGGYPAPETASPEVTTTIQGTVTTTSIAPQPTRSPGEQDGENGGGVSPVTVVQRYWPYLLSLLGLELLSLAGIGFYLFQRGLLNFPLLPPK